MNDVNPFDLVDNKDNSWNANQVASPQNPDVGTSANIKQEKNNVVQNDIQNTNQAPELTPDIQLNDNIEQSKNNSTQQQVDNTTQQAGTNNINNTNQTQPVQNNTQGPVNGKKSSGFVEKLVQFIAKVSGQPDPVSWKANIQKNTSEQNQNIVNEQVAQNVKSEGNNINSNEQNSQATQDVNNSQNTEPKKNVWADVLASVGNFLETMGNKAEEKLKKAIPNTSNQTNVSPQQTNVNNQAPSQQIINNNTVTEQNQQVQQDTVEVPQNVVAQPVQTEKKPENNIVSMQQAVMNNPKVANPEEDSNTNSVPNQAEQNIEEKNLEQTNTNSENISPKNPEAVA